MGTGKQRGRYYDPQKIEDAPEFYELAAAMGVLTSATWEHSARTFEERKADFIFAFPPSDPTRFVGSELEDLGHGRRGPASRGVLMRRFLSRDWRPGSLHELLARHGLRMSNAPATVARSFEPAPFLTTARRRNLRLRVLHGGVDIEAENMDEAKLAWIERQERIRAAEQVREARKQMHEEHEALASKDGADQ